MFDYFALQFQNNVKNNTFDLKFEIQNKEWKNQINVDFFR